MDELLGILPQYEGNEEVQGYVDECAEIALYEYGTVALCGEVCVGGGE